MEYMHIDIWAANDGKVKLTPIYGGAGLQTDDGKGVFVELKAQQWNHFDIPLTDFKGLDFTSIFQMKYSDGTPELTTFAIDNLYFYRTTAIEDTIAPTNLVATMDKADYFSITLNCTANDESGVVFFNVYSARNGRWIPNGYEHYFDEHTYPLVVYDDDGNVEMRMSVNLLAGGLCRHYTQHTQR